MINTLKAYIINILLVLIVCDNRLDFNSAECKIYLGKSGFHGDAAFIGTNSDVQINLRYNDTEYFNDPNYWGLVQEDGKTPETTCLDLKLYKFPSSDFLNGTQVRDFLITTSNNTQTLERCYSFTIKESDFSTRLIQTSNSSYYIYKGFYGIEFQVPGQNHSQHNFYFQFNVTVDSSTGAPIDISFKPYPMSACMECGWPSYPVLPLSKINWCSDFTCTTIGNAPNLHIQDSFVVQQVITTPGLTGYYLTETEVWYTGNGLNKKSTIKQVNNTVAGQVQILLNAQIVWGEIATIKVNSVLSSNPGRRVLAQTTFDTVTGYTDEIPCIKAQNQDTCPTCEQECDANGYARNGCEACTVSGSTILYGLIFVMKVFLI